MVKKWEFEGKVDISTGPFGLILWNAEKSDYEVVGIRALCQREKLEGKKVKITVETLDGEVDKMDEDVETFEKMDAVDRISKILHEAWTEWTKSLSDIESFDQLILQADRWEELWVPYEQLSEEMKEKDREWARKIIRACAHGGLEGSIFDFSRFCRDAKWLDENLIHFYEIVKGKTIAAKDEKILAMADDMDDLVRQLKEKGEDPGMVHTAYIPKEDDDLPVIL